MIADHFSATFTIAPKREDLSVNNSDELTFDLGFNVNISSSTVLQTSSWYGPSYSARWIDVTIALPNICGTLSKFTEFHAYNGLIRISPIHLRINWLIYASISNNWLSACALARHILGLLSIPLLRRWWVNRQLLWMKCVRACVCVCDTMATTIHKTMEEWWIFRARTGTHCYFYNCYHLHIEIGLFIIAHVNQELPILICRLLFHMFSLLLFATLQFRPTNFPPSHFCPRRAHFVRLPVLSLAMVCQSCSQERYCCASQRHLHNNSMMANQSFCLFVIFLTKSTIPVQFQLKCNRNVWAIVCGPFFPKKKKK